MSKSVMIVCGNTDDMLWLVRSLSGICVILVCASYESALSAQTKHRPDLVIIGDVQGGSGTALVEQFYQQKNLVINVSEKTSCCGAMHVPLSDPDFNIKVLKLVHELLGEPT
ncbi:MAG: hypothetical protein KW802_04640 [Candidatus Doudnabacteria bacterium]|nr:hypothetical protein [Candidatus Doudnabacteria bacterium]